MAETIMTFSLGFLIAALIALLLAAPMWRRAVLITTKRLMASAPASAEDFKADKDRMRAEFAMSARKLEMSVDSLRKKAETRLAELDKRKREVDSLRDEVQAKASLTGEQAEEIAKLSAQLETTQENLTRREEELTDIRTRLSEAQTVLTRQASAIKEANSLVEGHQQTEERLTSEVKAKSERIEQQSAELSKQAKTVLDRDTQLATCGRTVAEQKMLVAQQKATIAELTAKVDALTRSQNTARQQSTSAAERERALTEELSSTIEARDTALKQIESLSSEIARMKVEHSELIKQDQQETAMMRQRLGDLAVEVERTSGAIEQLIDEETETAAPAQSESDGNGSAAASNGAGEGMNAMGAAAKSLLTWSPRANQRRPADPESEALPVSVPPAEQIDAAQRKPASLAERIRSLQNDIRSS